MVGEEGRGIATKGYVENLRNKGSGEECKLPEIIVLRNNKVKQAHYSFVFTLSS